MDRRGLFLTCGSVCILAVVCWSSVASAEIVNIDFNGVRNNETVGLTFSGVGAAGGGSTFNGVVANSQGTPENDLLTVSAPNLLNSNGVATTIGFSITNVGGDNGGTGNDPTAAPALYGDYIFGHGSGGQPSNADPVFTFSGLGSATKADVYFYATNASTIAIGSTIATATSQEGGAYCLLHFQDVPVTGGQIVGTFGSSFGAAYGAIISVTSIPEPGSIVLMATGLFGLVPYAWRKRK